MDLQCREALTQYLAYLEDQFIVIPEVGGCRLVTPFSRQDGDSIEIVLLERPGGQLLITDEGGTSDYLFLSGLHLETNPEHLQEAEYIADRYRVDFGNDSELSVVVSNGNVGQGLHRLLSATVELGDLVFKQHAHTANTFLDEVDNFLVESGVSVSRGLDVQGQSSTHTIPFYINGMRNWLTQPVSELSRGSARLRGKLVAYQWLDIRRAGHDFTLVVILDDRAGQIEKFWHDPVIGKPLYDYSDLVFEWDQRDRILTDLRRDTR